MIEMSLSKSKETENKLRWSVHVEKDNAPFHLYIPKRRVPIDAGLDLRSLFGIDPGKRDFFGNPIPQGKGYDIGAHEIISKKL